LLTDCDVHEIRLITVATVIVPELRTGCHWQIGEQMHKMLLSSKAADEAVDPAKSLLLLIADALEHKSDSYTLK
jgi:hypothetical protein